MMPWKWLGPLAFEKARLRNIKKLRDDSLTIGQ